MDFPHDPQLTADVLTEAQVATFERDGFITIDQLADADEVASWRESYDELFARAGGFADNDRIDLAPVGERPVLPQIINPERYLPQLVRGRAYANARAVARQLLGGDAAAMGNHAINKPGGDGAPTPWHQDEAYWDPRFDHQAISIWIPLQAVTESNGCMVFVPGSQHGEVLPHRLIHADSHGLRLVDGNEPPGAVACPLPPGGATVHAGRTLHYAGPNRTPEARRAVVFGFARPARLRPEPHDYPWQRPEWSSSDS